MKKAYLVTYASDNGDKLLEARNRMTFIGSYSELSRCLTNATWLFVPNDEKVNAKKVCRSIASHLSPFVDSLGVIGLNTFDSAMSSDFGQFEVLDDLKCEDEVPRNFNRFKTLHEASVAYDLEKPVWCHSDGIGNKTAVDFNEWCWLPVKKDGMYEKSKYDKYLK